jgi:hypothetical protein
MLLGMAGFTVVSLSIFHDGTARPLAGTIIGLMVIATFSYIIAARHRS